jgi:hypothetical protein
LISSFVKSEDYTVGSKLLKDDMTIYVNEMIKMLREELFMQLKTKINEE